jgi:hypothetical protein
MVDTIDVLTWCTYQFGLIGSVGSQQAAAVHSKSRATVSAKPPFAQAWTAVKQSAAVSRQDHDGREELHGHMAANAEDGADDDDGDYGDYGDYGVMGSNRLYVKIWRPLRGEHIVCG